MYLQVINEKPAIITHPRPVLFVHGMWHAAWCWAENFQPCFSRQGYVSVALNLRGHGGSEGHEKLRWCSLNDYVSDLAQVVSELEAPPILIGHSMGGMVIQKYLESHEAAAAVLLASVPPGGVLLSTMRTFLRQPLSVIKSGLTLRLRHIVSTPCLAREAFFAEDMDEARVAVYFSQLQDESFRVFLDMLVFNLPRPRPLETPLLVLGAENDNMVSVKEVEATAQSYAVKAEIFSAMGHDMMLEARWQEVAEHILGWLDKQGL